MKLAVVEWVDSMGSNDWQLMKEAGAYTNPAVYSVGWILGSCKTHITLMSSTCPSQQQSGQTMTIPKGCIKRVRYVGSKYTIKA